MRICHQCLRYVPLSVLPLVTPAEDCQDLWCSLSLLFANKIKHLGCFPDWPEYTTRPTASRLLLIGIRNGWKPTDQIERQHHGRYFTYHHQLRKSVGIGFFVLVMATIDINPIKKSIQSLTMPSLTTSMLPIQLVRWNDLLPTFPYRFYGAGYLRSTGREHFCRLRSFANKEVWNAHYVNFSGNSVAYGF